MDEKAKLQAELDGAETTADRLRVAVRIMKQGYVIRGGLGQKNCRVEVMPQRVKDSLTRGHD